MIYGSGYIAVEFAGIFNGFGVDTHLVFRADKVLRGFDNEIREQLMTYMAQKGVTLHKEVTISEIEKVNLNYSVKLSNGKNLKVDEVMGCLLYTSPSPRDRTRSRMPSSA